MVFRQGQGNENVEDRMRMVIDLLSVYLHSLTCETTCHEYSKFWDIFVATLFNKNMYFKIVWFVYFKAFYKAMCVRVSYNASYFNLLLPIESNLQKILGKFIDLVIVLANNMQLCSIYSKFPVSFLW